MPEEAVFVINKCHNLRGFGGEILEFLGLPFGVDSIWSTWVAVAVRLRCNLLDPVASLL
jgi:hypothetical protein